MKMRSNQLDRKAFTLLELLIVVAIIGVLAGLLLPALGKAREKGYRVQCVSNMKQWGIAFEMYSNESGGMLQHTVGTFDWDDITGDVDGTTVTNVYLQYMGGGKASDRIHTMRICPSAAARMSKDQVDHSSAHTYAMGWPLAFASRSSTYTSFAPKSGEGVFINLRVLTKPAEYLLLIDSSKASYVKCSELLKKCSVEEGVGGRTAVQRHNGGVNALFADYHVEYLPESQLKKQDAVNCTKGNPWFMME